MKPQPTIAIPLADGRTVEHHVSDVASMWWAWDSNKHRRQLMVSVKHEGMQTIYTTRLDWGEAVGRVWGADA